MKNRTHLYVSRKNVLTWLMALCMAASAVTRIWIFGVNGSENPLGQILLPITATTLYALIALFDGKEHFYRTAIPAWLMALYCWLWIRRVEDQLLLSSLFFIALVFFASSYTDIVSGHRQHTVLLLLPVVLAPLAYMAYYCREALLQVDKAELRVFLPDMLALLGAAFQVCAIRVHPMDEYHPTWGDRPDGRRLRSLSPMDQITSYFQVERNTCSNLFEESFEITKVDHYIRQKRREGMTEFGITHVLLAAYVRCVAKYPQLNRFISGQRVYSRGNDIQYCMTVKKEMSVESPDTAIKVHLTPYDTSRDVYEKLSAAVADVKRSQELDSSLDGLIAVLLLIPGVFMKFTVWFLKMLDYFGLVPKFLLELSPFHGSLYMTSMGSLGIRPIYHHLYDFGNIPVFGAFGMKRRANEVLEDGTVVSRKYIDMKFTLDERICDGYCYATFFKYFRRILQHPEILDLPPEEVNRDID